MGYVPAGSLIFVIIVAIWAAYLIQHWVRRQESSAGSRSVERFSRAMRVLERPPVDPDAVPAARAPSRVSSARVIRPVVEVKRATPAGDIRRSPLVARTSTETAPETPEVEPMPHSQTPHASAPPVSPVQRRLRAMLLILSVAWVPTSVVLVVLGRLLWVSIPLSVLTVLAVVVWLRTEAVADVARRSLRATRGRGRHAHVLSSDDTQVIRHEAVAQAAAAAEAAAAAAAEAAQVAAAHVAAQAVAHATEPASAHGVGRPGHRGGPLAAPAAGPATHAPAASAAEASPAAYEQVFDGEAMRSQPVPVQPPAEGTWQPVPVPRPTYAMKAKAQPRMTAGGVPADVFDTPEFAEEADELDERALFARRAVSE